MVNIKFISSSIWIVVESATEVYKIVQLFFNLCPFIVMDGSFCTVPEIAWCSTLILLMDMVRLVIARFCKVVNRKLHFILSWHYEHIH